MPKSPILTDAEWRKIEPLLPRSRTYQPRIDDKVTLSAIFYAAATNRSLEDVAASYGLIASTARTRIRAWEQAGRWQSIQWAGRAPTERFRRQWVAKLGGKSDPMARLFRAWGRY